MARIRSVHPGLFIDDAFMELSWGARLLLIGIWVQADDHGIFELRPKSLKAAIFPGDDGTDTEGMLKELVEQDCIRVFDVEEKPYGAIRNFCKYQHPKKPYYRHPMPPWGRSYVAFEPPPEGNRSPPDKEKEKEREKEKDSTKTTTESLERVAPAMQSEPSPPAPETLSPKKTASQGKVSSLGAILGKPLPADWVPDDKLCEEVKTAFGMTDEDLQADLPAFHALNVQNGVLSANWNSTFYLFCKRWREHRDKQAPPRVQLSRTTAHSAPQRTKPEDFSEGTWDGIVKLYAQTGRWSRDAGPDPMHVGRCLAPRHILERYDINIETGERRIPPKVVA